ncbi:hypothetical protein [Nocardia fusca]|nr:hypothetical protein [Nocardia fusca]
MGPICGFVLYGAVIMSIAAGSAGPLDRVSAELLDLLDHHHPAGRE